MKAETQAIRIPEKIMRQIRSDCHNAILRAHLRPSEKDLVHLRCVDHRLETESAFGSQLWYFEGLVANADSQRVPLFGALEYSLQFGLHELADCGVFDSTDERQRFYSVYRQGHFTGSLRHPAHRWLAIGMLLVAIATLLRFVPRLLAE
jgi:hypothetical protein